MHLRMSVGGEIRYYLITCNTHANGAANGFSCDFSSDHVWVSGGKAGKEGKDGNLQI